MKKQLNSNLAALSGLSTADQAKLPPEEVTRSGFFWYKGAGANFTAALANADGSALPTGTMYKLRVTSWTPNGSPRGNGAPNFSIIVNGERL